MCQCNNLVEEFERFQYVRHRFYVICRRICPSSIIILNRVHLCRTSSNALSHGARVALTKLSRIVSASEFSEMRSLFFEFCSEIDLLIRNPAFPLKF